MSPVSNWTAWLLPSNRLKSGFMDQFSPPPPPPYFEVKQPVILAGSDNSCCWNVGYTTLGSRAFPLLTQFRLCEELTRAVRSVSGIFPSLISERFCLSVSILLRLSLCLIGLPLEIDWITNPFRSRANHRLMPKLYYYYIWRCRS